MAISSCVEVPPGPAPGWYAGGAAYGGSQGDAEWHRERWKREEEHRREMVKRQEEYRRKLAEVERERSKKEDEWRREELKKQEEYQRKLAERQREGERRREAYEPGPSYENDAMRRAPWGAAPPSGEPRLKSPDENREEAPRDQKTDYPIGIPVIGKEGMVYNPAGNPKQMIDVRGIPSGTLVKDPYTDTLFRVP